MQFALYRVNATRLKELRQAFTPRCGTNGEVRYIEGPHLLEEAVRAGLRVACVFVAEDAAALAGHLPVTSKTEVLIVPRALLQLLAVETERAALAALVGLPDWTWSPRAARPRKLDPLVLVLAALQEPGNVGTIWRSAEAVGAAGIISLPGTGDEWNPQAGRASAGSIFRVPVLSATLDGQQRIFANRACAS